MPATHNTKNFFAHGGEELVIGGTLTFLEGATVTGLPEGTTPAAENQAASTATTVAGLKEDFNTLLAALKAAGLMIADTPAEPEPEETPEETPGEGDTPGGEGET